MDVLLDDASPLFIYRSVSHQRLYLIKVFGHLDTLSSVCVFTWFNDPNIPPHRLRELLEFNGGLVLF